MNRWIYYLIGLRFKGVGQTQRYKRPSKFRIAVNIICYILSAIMLSVIFAYGGFWAFLAGGSFFGIVLAFFSSMSVGKDLIYTQAMIAKEQIRGERPLDFNHKLVKLGYVMSFAPVYIITDIQKARFSPSSGNNTVCLSCARKSLYFRALFASDK